MCASTVKSFQKAKYLENFENLYFFLHSWSTKSVFYIGRDHRIHDNSIRFFILRFLICHFNNQFYGRNSDTKLVLFPPPNLKGKALKKITYTLLKKSRKKSKSSIKKSRKNQKSKKISCAFFFKCFTPRPNSGTVKCKQNYFIFLL